MAGLDRLPAATPTILDATRTIGGSVGRKVLTGFGGVSPILAHGAGIPADLYGLHQEEILRQPVVTVGAGLIPRADYGLRAPANQLGLQSDLSKSLAPKLPRGVG